MQKMAGFEILSSYVLFCQWGVIKLL